MEQNPHNTFGQQSTKPTLEPLISSLCKADAYDHEVNEIRVIETHISWVLLTGKYAYKLKKPVNFGFLDFSTLAKRYFCCQEELRLNRRLAVDLYLKVLPITGTPAAPKINGSGPAFEYAVKMRQFPPDQLLDKYSNNRQLQAGMIDQISNIIADFHKHTEIASADSPYGRPEDIRHWFLENFVHIKPLLPNNEHDLRKLQQLQSWGETEWHDKADLMQQRKLNGFVRECHGDLHLGNMAMIDSRVTPFDCIEFNPKLRWIDVFSEIAFVFMDLQYRGWQSYAFRCLNLYLQKTGDYQGLSVLPYYFAYRALVRAKVSLLLISQHTDEQVKGGQNFTEYKAYIDLINQFNSSHNALLIITHGYSGSGKSTISARLADRMGAIVIRSDIERKRLFDIQAREPSNSAINRGLYSKHAGRLTYQKLADLAASLLEAGFPTIIDATFLVAEQRERFHQLANVSCVPFIILNFVAPEKQLRKRILQRQQQANDASEATIAVLEQQIQSADSLTAAEQSKIINIETSHEVELDAIVKRIKNF